MPSAKTDGRIWGGRAKGCVWEGEKHRKREERFRGAERKRLVVSAAN